MYNRFDLLFCTVPDGAGGSYLGYLQQVHDGLEPHKPSKRNVWDSKYLYYVSQHSEPFVGLHENSIDDNKLCRDQDIKNIINTKTIFNFQLAIKSHIFPTITFNQWDRAVNYFMVDTDDLETNEYCWRLQMKKLHPGDKKDENYAEEQRLRFIENHNAIINHPPKVHISYKKFFLDIDEKEITKFFEGMGPDFNKEKLDQLCTLIKGYTTLNRELV